MRDFTLQQYRDLCAGITEAGYQGISMSDYLAKTHEKDYLLVLRHDVDRQVSHALQLARIEAGHGLRATYFFRMVPPLFVPDVIRDIAALGHEIGYHYETLAISKGDIPRAIELFREQLVQLRTVAPVHIASMHGSPLSQYDNRLIWEHVSPADFDLHGEAYRDFDYSILQYYNDTGRTWHPAKYNLRDTTGHNPRVLVEHTEELCAMIATKKVKHLCISTHPERWHDDPLPWLRQATQDVIINAVKLILKKFRR